MPKNRFVVALHALDLLDDTVFVDRVRDIRLCEHPDLHYGPSEVCYGEYAIRRENFFDVLQGLYRHLIRRGGLPGDTRLELDAMRGIVPVLIIQNLSQ